ncbi:putative ubiquitin-conjugating enzyme E2 38 [Tanacetum coccineum]
MKEKDVDDVVEEQILTIKLKAEDLSKKLMKYKLKITNSDDVIVISVEVACLWINNNQRETWMKTGRISIMILQPTLLFSIKIMNLDYTLVVGSSRWMQVMDVSAIIYDRTSFFKPAVSRKRKVRDKNFNDDVEAKRKRYHLSEIKHQLVNKRIKLLKGQPTFVVKEVENEATATLLVSKTQRNNLIHAITREHIRLTTRRLLVRDRNSHCDIFTMEKVIVYKRKAEKAALDIKDVKKSFKKFDTLADHSGHLFAHENSPMNKANNMFVRFYESRMDLLRFAIIEAKGTPYHDGLFFFDMYFTINYPKRAPYVRYHSVGLEINPNLYKNGRVRLSLPKQTGMTREVEVDMWVMLTLLVSIQDQILNAKPFYNFFMLFWRNTVYKEESSLIYNEHILLNSLKTMVHIMSKPPKYFDDLVVGHFRNRAHDILTSCKAYTEGVRPGCCGVQEEDKGKTSTMEFRKDVASCMKLLVTAFKWIEAKELPPI